MNDLPSPAYTAAGFYSWTSSLLFLDKTPSQRFQSLWKRLHRKLESHKLRDGSELIDFEGSNRRQALQELQFFPREERLEFLHWLSMEAHEYVHSYDFHSTGFGYKTLRQRVFQVYETLKVLANDPIRIPLLKVKDNRNTILEFRRRYQDMQGMTNILLGSGFEVGSEVGATPFDGIVAYLPANMPNWEIPLPALRVRDNQGKYKLIPITTKHILEARAILVQLSAIEHLTGPQYAHEYFSELQNRCVKKGFISDSPFLEYTLVITFLHNALGSSGPIDPDLYFNILDLSLQINHESRDVWDLHPPIILLNVVSEFVSRIKDPSLHSFRGFAKFLENSVTAPKRSLLATKRREHLQSVISVPSEHFVDELFQNQARTELDYHSASEQIEDVCLSPKKFYSELIANGSKLPRTPLTITRNEDFSRLTIYTDGDGIYNRLYLLQHVLTDLLNDHEIHCPYKACDGLCTLKHEGCGTHRAYYRTEKEACLFGLILIDLHIADRFEEGNKNAMQ